MNKDLIIRMQGQFDQLAQTHPEEHHLEFWFARDLQEPLGYARWENFLSAIQRAIESCKTTGYEPGHHFRGVTKLITLGSGVERSNHTIDRDDESQAVKYRDDLQNTLQKIHILLIGKGKVMTMKAVNERENITVLSYPELIAIARKRVMWLIRELKLSES